jgi:hypothetical protein
MSRVPPVPRMPYLLLGGLTLVSFGGPFAMLVIVRGGPSARWPPDRAVEWVVIGLVFTLAAALFSACVSLGWWYPGLRPSQKAAAHDPGSPSRPASS